MPLSLDLSASSASLSYPTPGGLNGIRPAPLTFKSVVPRDGAAAPAAEGFGLIESLRDVWRFAGIRGGGGAGTEGSRSSSSLSSILSRLFNVGFGLRLATGASPSSPSSRALFFGAVLPAAIAFPSSSILGFLVYLRFCLGVSAGTAPSAAGAAAAGFSFSLKPPGFAAAGAGAASPFAGGAGGAVDASLGVRWGS